jgi:hypothetical protein
VAATQLDLRKLLREVGRTDEFENASAHYQTKTPWIGKAAYLNIIFKPALEIEIKGASGELRIPEVWQSFLGVQNGGILFSSLSVYGILALGQLHGRTRGVLTQPHNVRLENRERSPDYERFLAVGSYTFDGSTVCIDRTDGSAKLFYRRNPAGVHLNDSAPDWMAGEVTRLSSLFDSEGRCVCAESETVPFRRC